MPRMYSAVFWQHADDYPRPQVAIHSEEDHPKLLLNLYCICQFKCLDSRSFDISIYCVFCDYLSVFPCPPSFQFSANLQGLRFNQII